MQELPVYVINLARRPDRYAVVSKQLDRLGIAHERVPAVDAMEIDREISVDLTLTSAEAAVRASHARAMSRLLEADARAALIIEDDAVLASDTPSLLRSTDWWPAGARVVRLEANPFGNMRLGKRLGSTPDGRGVHRLHGIASGSAAYMVDRRGAILARSELCRSGELRLPIDMALFNLRTSKLARRLRTAQINPGAARQMSYSDSDIERSGVDAQWRRAKRSRCYSMRLGVLRTLGIVSRARVTYQDRPTS